MESGPGPDFTGWVPLPVIWLIRLYQRRWSRYTNPCPAAESCSDYAIRIIHEHGTHAGLTRFLDRIEAGCNRPV